MDDIEASSGTGKRVGKLVKRAATHNRVSERRHVVADTGSYRPYANAMLATATFAGTITLTVILTPGDGTRVPGLNLPSYSSSIFIGSIMGCICLISSIELNIPFRFMRALATILGLMLFSAFYLLLLAVSLFLNYRGPFILGSILYLGFGVLLGVLSLADWTIGKVVRTPLPDERYVGA
jgi:hypothetical protein